MNYGKALKLARAIAGLQQREVAARAGIDPSHVSLIEAGKRHPSVQTVESLSRALSLPSHLFVLMAADEEDFRIADPQELKRATETLANFMLTYALRKEEQPSNRRNPR